MEDTTQGLKETVNVDTAMKSWLVNYVGEQHSPEGDAVTVEMIVETMAKEFPFAVFFSFTDIIVPDKTQSLIFFFSNSTKVMQLY